MKNPIMFVGLLAFLPMQASSMAFNFQYGLAGGVMLGIFYLSMDVCAIFFFEMAARPALGKPARAVASFWAVALIIVAFWTSFSLMAAKSLEKTISDNNATLVQLEQRLTTVQDQERQAIDASQRKPNRESMYLDKAHRYGIEAAALLSDIRKVRAETPSTRQAVYQKTAGIFPQLNTGQIEVAVIAALCFLGATSGGLVWFFMALIRNATSATKPEPARPRGTSRKKKTVAPKRNVKPQLKVVQSGTTSLERNIMRAVNRGALKPSSRQVLKMFGGSEKKAREALKALHEKGYLKKVGNQYQPKNSEAA